MTPPLNSSILSAASSVSSLSMESTTSGSQNHSVHKTPSKTPSKSSNNHELPAHINAQLQPNSPLLKANGNNVAPDFYIIKVTCETDSAELEGIVLYKSIMLSNNERTPQVIRNAMMKLGLEGDSDKLTLSQILPDKELMLPANANVYYAVNTQFNLNFILRHKKDGWIFRSNKFLELVAIWNLKCNAKGREFWWTRRESYLKYSQFKHFILVRNWQLYRYYSETYQVKKNSAILSVDSFRSVAFQLAPSGLFKSDISLRLLTIRFL